MTSESADGSAPAPDKSEESRAEEPRATSTDGKDTDPPSDDESVPPKQIHRWKSEGGALHPDE